MGMFGKTVGSALRSPRPPSTTMISKSSVEKPRFVRSVRKTSHSPSLSERAIRKSPWARLCIDGTPPARRAERILERQLDPEGDPEGGSRVLQDIRAAPRAVPESCRTFVRTSRAAAGSTDARVRDVRKRWVGDPSEDLVGSATTGSEPRLSLASLGLREPGRPHPSMGRQVT